MKFMFFVLDWVTVTHIRACITTFYDYFGPHIKLSTIKWTKYPSQYHKTPRPIISGCMLIQITLRQKPITLLNRTSKILPHTPPKRSLIKIY